MCSCLSWQLLFLYIYFQLFYLYNVICYKLIDWDKKKILITPIITKRGIIRTCIGEIPETDITHMCMCNVFLPDCFASHQRKSGKLIKSQFLIKTTFVFCHPCRYNHFLKTSYDSVCMVDEHKHLYLKMWLYTHAYEEIDPKPACVYLQIY